MENYDFENRESVIVVGFLDFSGYQDSDAGTNWRHSFQLWYSFTVRTFPIMILMEEIEQELTKT